MQIGIKEFLNHCGIEDNLYPGKRVVKKLPHPGEFKSHCVVLDWHNPALLHIEIKAGLSGRTLPVSELKKYPVSFQAPTYIDIATANQNAAEDGDGDEEEGHQETGRGGGGGKGLARKKSNLMQKAFSTVVEGNVPELGDIKKLVIMGKEIARESYVQVLEKLAEQIRQSKVMVTDLMAEAGKFITRVTPPAFMARAGNEDVVYKYDREKNEPMFGRPMMG